MAHGFFSNLVHVPPPATGTDESDRFPGRDKRLLLIGALWFVPRVLIRLTKNTDLIDALQR